MNKKMILYTLGKLLKVEGVLLLMPMLVSLIYRESSALVFGLVAVGIFLLGTLLSSQVPKKKNIYAKEGLFIVSVSWCLLSALGALPFVLTGEIPSYVDALFETVSGFTTTGSSVVSDLSVLSHGSLFWRSFTHWIGGMGVLVFTVAFVPLASGQTMHILKAEMPGPVVGKLVSKIHVTARILYIMYSVLTVIEICLLLAGGMPVFDSILNAFATAGTGGFSMSNGGIAIYNSVYIESVITVFMILFGINFNLIYFVLIGRVLTTIRNEELRWYLGIIVTAMLGITINIAHMYQSYLEAFRYASFQVASIITTTGFATADYNTWPMFSQMIIMLLMFIGASAGSTGGGMKVSRIIILVKNGRKEIKKLLHPRSVVSVEFEGAPVSTQTINNIHSYLTLYVVVFISALLLLSLENFDFQTTFSAVVTCINNIGPGFGRIGPMDDFALFSNFSKLVLSFVMLAGRLEIFPMIILFSKSFWKG